LVQLSAFSYQLTAFDHNDLAAIAKKSKFIPSLCEKSLHEKYGLFSAEVSG
jgi:hypothetical protein